MSNLTPEELARQAGQHGTFSFIDRLRGRNYAKDDIDVYLDEDLGYKLERLHDALKSEEVPVTMHEEIIEQIKSVTAALEESKYTFYLEGMSNERYDELIDEAKEQYPYEYEEFTDPWSGKKVKSVIPLDERNELFTALLWAESIKKVVDHEGNVDESINSEFVATIRRQAPLAVIKRIGDTIDKLRMASEWIEYIEDEDFLVKP
jgi:uncharacterized protein Yka (UPF0111/DUF47 family)